jgi:PTH1 family peptidyl-tRNA hydrolase
MNRSGVALDAVLAQPAFDPAVDLLVLVDDFALPLGSFRLRARGSAGGHGGLESVEARLGSPEYARLRIGVGPVPEDVDAADFVLAPFAKHELETLAELLPELADAVECWVAEGIEVAMNRFNRKRQGPESD